MTLIEKAFWDGSYDDAWGTMESCCPQRAFGNDTQIPKICESNMVTRMGFVDCSKCWLQEYKEEYGEVIPK